MRIIGGKYKGKRVQSPKKFPSRPTTDMAKEALFGILDSRYHWENKDVLDLFAGTGNISLEFLSRGVQSVLSVDVHPIAIKHLNKILKEWEIVNWSILKKDAIKFITAAHQKFDIIFADPPFALKNLPELPDLIFSSDLLNQEGIFILEHGRENDFQQHPYFTEMRNYGGVVFSFFEKH